MLLPTPLPCPFSVCQWCAVFLVVMSLLEGGSLESGLERVRHEWRELLLGNLGFFVPVSVLLLFFKCINHTASSRRCLLSQPAYPLSLKAKTNN